MNASLEHFTGLTGNPDTSLRVITVTRDEFGTFKYEFAYNGTNYECFDFISVEAAVSGAKFHLYCLANSLPHEVVDGLGACFLG